MPTSFSFDANYLASASTLERGNLSTNYPSAGWAWAVAPNQSIATSTGVDVFSMTMVAGQSYFFNLSSANIALEVDIIDQNGRIVKSAQDGASGWDLGWTADRTGSYFIAVHHTGNDYVDGSFGFERTPGRTGSYQFAVATNLGHSPSDPIPTPINLTDASNTYYDRVGDHIVRANGGNDWISLGSGADIGLGGAGNDQLYGGNGDDDLSGGSGLDTIEGGTGNDVARGGDGGDLLSGNTGNDAILGGAGSDRLYGDSRTVASDIGNDILWGEAGNDSIYGGAGSDVIRGGADVDRMWGGSGADSFHFLPTEAAFDSSDWNGITEDRIEDFTKGQDRIDLSDVVWGALSFIGTSRFQDVSGGVEVRIDPTRSSGGYQELQVDTNGDAAPDLAFLVHATWSSGGYATLSASDFLL